MTVTAFFDNTGTIYVNGDPWPLGAEDLAERVSGPHLQTTWPISYGQRGAAAASNFMSQITTAQAETQAACTHDWRYYERVLQQDRRRLDIDATVGGVASIALTDVEDEQILDSIHAEVRCQDCGLDIRCTDGVDTWEIA